MCVFLLLLLRKCPLKVLLFSFYSLLLFRSHIYFFRACINIFLVLIHLFRQIRDPLVPLVNEALFLLRYTMPKYLLRCGAGIQLFPERVLLLCDILFFIPKGFHLILCHLLIKGIFDHIHPGLSICNGSPKNKVELPIDRIQRFPLQKNIFKGGYLLVLFFHFCKDGIISHHGLIRGEVDLRKMEKIILCVIHAIVFGSIIKPLCLSFVAGYQLIMMFIFIAFYDTI